MNNYPKVIFSCVGINVLFSNVICIYVILDKTIITKRT